MKRILCFLASFLLLAVVFCSAISASNNYSPGMPVYTLAHDRNLGTEEFGHTDINIYQYGTDSPTYVTGDEGWYKQYFLGAGHSNGIWNVALFNGTSLKFVFLDTVYSCYYCYTAYDGEINIPIALNLRRTADFFVYVDRNGNFEVCYYSTSDLTIIRQSNDVLQANLSGAIFPYGEIPGTDGSDSSYQQGYDKGYQEGSEATYSEAYNLGYARGQNTENIVGNALSGFFTGMQNFFFPFLQIGIGSFTLSNLLGIIATVFIVIIILKIVRG